MKKLTYKRPEVREFMVSPDDVMSGELVAVSKIDNTGQGGSDDEKYEVNNGDLDDGDEVGAKGFGGSWNYDEENW